MAGDPTLTLDEIVGHLADYCADDDDKRSKAGEVAKALHRNPSTQPVAQILVGRGVTRTSAAQASKITELETTISSLRADLKEREDEIAEYKKEAPDWKKRLDEQEAKHQKKVAELTGTLDTERKARREDRLSRERARFTQKLQPGVLVDPDYVEVLANKYADRFRLRADDPNKLEVLEPGSDTPYDAADGSDPLDLLVGEVLKGVPPKWKLLGEARPGAGVHGERTGDLKPLTLDQLKEKQRASGLYAF